MATFPLLRRTLLPAFLGAGLLAACAGGDGGISGVLVVASVEVSPGIVDVVVGKSTPLTATPKTSSGIVVPGRGVTWSTTDGGIATVSTSGIVTGVREGGPVRIRATVDGVTGDAVITVRPVPVDHITVDPPEKGILVNSQFLFTAKALDASGSELPGRSFSWQSSNSGIAAVTSTGLVLGVAEGGPVTISASSEGKTGTALVSVATRPATRLGFLQQPGLAIAGQPMVPPVRIALQDDFLATVLGAANPVTIQLAGNPGGATLTGTTTRSPVNGVVTFSDLVLNRAGAAYTFQVTSPGLQSQTSSPFDVTPGSANQLSFTTPPPGTAQSGVVLTAQPALQLRDGSGNPVAQAGVVITASIGSGPAGASLQGTLTATTNTFGTASFANLAISGAGGSYTLAFAASGVNPLTSAAIVLSAGTATQLFIATQPSSGAQSGVPLAVQPALQLRDATGNNVPQGGVVVTASIASGGGLLGGTATATTNGSGLATFTGLAINGPAGQYTLAFAAPGLVGATSGTITLGAGAATQLAITTQPSGTASSGVAFARQPVVQLRDGSNNPVSAAGVQVTVTVSSGTLSGTLSKTTDGNGNASFTDLAITGPSGSYTLTFNASGITPATSSAIVLGAGAANKLTITTQPSATAQSGVAFPQQPVIQLRDGANNPVNQSGVVVTATIASGGGTLGGTTTATTNTSGVATFTNLSISGTAGDRTLSFSSGALTPVTSATIALGAGPATTMAANSTTSQSTTVGTPVPVPPSVKVSDASGNPVQGVAVVFTITAGGGSSSPSSPATIGTNSAGIASLTSWTVGSVVGANSVTATSSGLSSITFNATATAGLANKLSIVTQPPASAQSGVTMSPVPVVQVVDNLGNPVAQSGVVVTVNVSTGSPATFNPPTATTDASGKATFTGLAMSGVVGTRTLFFSAPGFSSTNASSPINLTAGPAAIITANSVTTQSATVGTAVGAPPSVKVTDASGNAVAGTAVVFTVTAGGGSSNPASPATINTGSGGIASLSSWTLGTTAGTNNNTVTASSGTLAGSPVTFNASGTAGTASKLGIITQPAGGASGGALSAQPVVAIQDASGNTVTSDNTTQVTVAIFSGAGGTLGGTLTRTVVNGIATFTDVTLSGTVGTNYVLRFTSSPTLTAANSTNVTVSAGSPSKLGIVTQPVGGASGGLLATQPVIAIQDAQGNTVTTDNTTQVTVALFSGAGGTLGGTLTRTAVNGVATFTNVTLSGAVGTNYVLRFTSNPALTAVNSNNVTVTSGGATQLAITTQPVGGASGAALTTQPVIAIRDAANNTVTTDNSTQVTVAIFSGTGGTLGGTQTVTAVNGVATFTNLTLAGIVATNYVLRFTSTPTLTAASSNNVTVTPGAANKLGLVTQPVGGASGAALATQPAVAIQDAQGNTVTTDNTTQVTVAIFSGTGGTLGGTLTRTAVNGVATFTNVTLAGTVGTNYVLRFTSNPVLTAVNSNNVTVTAGTANKLGITTQPVGGASGAPLATQPVIVVQDAQGNTVTSDNTTQVTVAIFSGAGGSLGGTLTLTAASGVATFTNVTLTGNTGTNYVLRFTSNPALTAVNSSNVTLTAGGATQLVITTQPVGGASGAALATQPVIAVRDAANNTVTTDNSTQVTVAIFSGTGGTLGGTQTVTAVNGVATFTNLTLAGTAGTNYVLRFTSNPALTAANSNNVTVTAGTANKLGITTQPAGGASGAALATQPVIAIQDAQGNTVTTDNTTQVTVAVFSGTGGTLGGTLTKTAVNGIATFTNLTLAGTVGTNYVLRFTSNPALTAINSNNVTVTAGAANKLGITTQPVGGASGATLATQPIITIQDAQGNTVTTDNATQVTVAIFSGAGGSLGGTLTVTATSGVATFTNVTLTGNSGTNYVLRFTSNPALTAVNSNNVTVSSGGATQLVITTQPVGGASGATLATQPVVAIRDASNNTVTTDNSTQVTVAISSGAGGTLGGTLTRTAVNGVVTFTNVTLAGTVGINYVLQFTSSPVLTAANSNNVTVTAGAANTLGITTQPVGGASGAALATQPVLAIQDAQGNTVTSDNATQVTVAIFSGAGGTLGGTQTVTAVNGVATFTNVTLAGTVGTNYVLRFTSSPVLTAANSNNVTLTAGAANKLGITTQPVGGASGAALATQPVVAIQDAQGNTITTDNATQVTVAIFSGAGGSLGGTLTVTAASGVATFTNVTLTGTSGTDYVLRFTSNPALTAVNSNTVQVSSGGATQLAITTQPVGGASGAALATQPVVAIKDGSNNTVTSDNSTQVTVAIFSGAGGTLGGTQTVTAVNGVATFTNVTLAGTVGTNYVLRFTSSPVLTAANSNNVTLTAGAANKLGITTQPVGGASGAALATQPVIAVQDAQGNTVTGDNTTQVSVAIFSGAGGTLGGTQTVTAVNGVATFTNVTLAGTVGTNYVLRFTSNPALTAVNSNNVSVTAGAANKLGITTQPVGGASGAPLATQPVIAIQDAQGNTVTSDNATQVTVAIFSGAGGSLGGTLTVTAASGVATFTNVTLTGTSGTDYVLRFTSSPALTAVNSNNVQVASGGPTGGPSQLVITTQPVGGASGAVLTTQPVVAIRDESNNTVTSDNSTQVTVAIFSGTGGTLGGTQTVSAVNGVATFTNVTLAGTVGTNYVLGFTSSPVLTAANSNNVTVTAGAASKLGITTQPVGGASGAALAPQPVIAIQDAQGNTVTSDNATQVTVAIFSGPGGTLGGTQTVTAASGVATFTNVTLTGTSGTDYVLRFTSSPVLTPVNSNNVQVSSGGASQLAITTQPLGGASGAALTTQPVIAIKDGSNNTVTSDNSTQVSVAIFSGTGGTLGGTQTVTAVNGVATFTDLTLAGTVGTNYVLQFTSTPALTAANSNNVTVTAGAAAQVTYNTQPPSSATNGQAFSTAPVLLVRDASNNPVGGASVTAAISTSPGGTPTFVGSSSATTNGSGVATFTGLGLTGLVGNYKLTFTAGSATSAESNTITLSAGSASAIVALSATAQPATISTAVADPPSVKVTDQSGNPVPGRSVTFAVTNGGGVVAPITPVSTNSSGIATATSWIVGASDGTNNNTVTATSTGLSGSPVSFTASGTTATKIVITSQPTTATSGAAMGTVSVRLKDAADFNVTQPNIPITASLQSGTGSLSGTLTVTTTGQGISNFTNLIYTGTGSFTLRFTAGNLTPATSSSITIP